MTIVMMMIIMMDIDNDVDYCNYHYGTHSTGIFNEIEVPCIFTYMRTPTGSVVFASLNQTSNISLVYVSVVTTFNMAEFERFGNDFEDFI